MNEKKRREEKEKMKIDFRREGGKLHPHITNTNTTNINTNTFYTYMCRKKSLTSSHRIEKEGPMS
jgi:hypothetical protein